MAVEKEILVMNVKKVIPWATGLAVLITKEARVLGWTDKDQVILTAYRDEKGDCIELRRVPIKRSEK